MPGIYYKTALLLIYFGQGIIFSMALLIQSRRANESSSKWLSLLVFLSCLYIAPWMLGHSSWYAMDGYREFLFFFPFHQLFLIGPVIYFYVQSLIKPGFTLDRKAYLHFLPSTLYFLYSLLVFVVDFFILDEFYFYADGKDKDLSPWYQITGTISILAYTTSSYQNYQKYKARILDEVSFAENITYGWLKRFLLSLIFILALRVLFMLALPNWGDFGLKWWYYLIFACTFYYITFAGYTNGILASFAYQLPSPRLEENQTKELIIADVEKWKAKIHAYVVDASAYKNPRLTLQDVASHLKTNPRIISQSINQGFEMNFNDYVNEARLEALKARIDNEDHLHFTLLALAMDCGFNSKSTFNRVFKNRMGITPNDYLKKANK
ncbi:MAG: helix-turn-helix transcriptional regulator [Ekhidna sp.]